MRVSDTTAPDELRPLLEAVEQASANEAIDKKEQVHHLLLFLNNSF